MALHLRKKLRLALLPILNLSQLSFASAESGQLVFAGTIPLFDDDCEAATTTSCLSLLQLGADVRHGDDSKTALLLSSVIGSKTSSLRAHVDIPDLSLSSVKPRKQTSQVGQPVDVSEDSPEQVIHHVAWNRLLSSVAVTTVALDYFYSSENILIGGTVILVVVLLCIFALSERGAAGGALVQIPMGHSQSARMLGSEKKLQYPHTPRTPSFKIHVPDANSRPNLTSVVSLSPTHLTSAVSCVSNGTAENLQQAIPCPLSSCAKTKPDPIAGELVLTLCESWFAIPLADLDHTAGAVPVFGLSGKRLLTANIQKDRKSGEGTLNLALKDGGAMLGSIKSFSEGPMVIAGKTNTHYGELRCTGHLCYSLVCGSNETMRIVFGAQSKQMLLLSSVDGSTLATASRLQGSDPAPIQDDHLQVKVDMGMDPVLALLCIIASVVFHAKA